MKSEQLTVDAVRVAVRTVLGDPSYAAASAGVQSELEALPDIAETAHAVEALVGGALPR